jgi:hypothetical protein
MWRAQLVQGTVVTVIVVLVAGHLVNIWALAVAGFFLGSAQVVFANAAQSVLPSLVPPDLLPKANGTQYVVQVIGGSFLGPPAGAALFATAPFAPFGVDAVSFAGSAALLRGLPVAHPSRGRSSTERGSAGISAGLRWLARHRLLRIVAVLLAVSNFCSQIGMATLVGRRCRHGRHGPSPGCHRARGAAGLPGVHRHLVERRHRQPPATCHPQ